MKCVCSILYYFVFPVFFFETYFLRGAGFFETGLLKACLFKPFEIRHVRSKNFFFSVALKAFCLTVEIVVVTKSF